MNSTHSGGAMISCPISGTPASMTWWARPLQRTKTDLTANQSSRLWDLSGFMLRWSFNILDYRFDISHCFLLNIYINFFTGSDHGPLPETSPEWEQQVPQLAEAELQPTGGGVAALESSPQAFDQWERSMGQQVGWHRILNQWFKKTSLATFPHVNEFKGNLYHQSSAQSCTKNIQYKYLSSPSLCCSFPVHVLNCNFPFATFLTEFNQRWNGNCPMQRPIQRCVSNLCPTTTMILTLKRVPSGTTWVCHRGRTYTFSFS